MIKERQRLTSGFFISAISATTASVLTAFTIGPFNPWQETGYIFSLHSRPTPDTQTRKSMAMVIDIVSHPFFREQTAHFIYDSPLNIRIGDSEPILRKF